MQKSQVENERLEVPVSLNSYTVDNEKSASQKLMDEGAIEPREFGMAEYNLAKIYYDKSDLIRAEEKFLSSMKYVEYPKDIFNQFKILGFLVRIASEQLNSENSEKYIKMSKDLLEKAGEVLPTLTAEYFYNMGLLRTYEGKFDEARDNFELAFRKAREENEPNIQAKTLHAMATNYFHHRNYDEARRQLDHMKDLLDILQKKYLLGTLLTLRGQIDTEQGRFDEALANFEAASQCLIEKSCWNLYGYILLSEGIVRKKMGEYEKAMWYFNLADSSTDPKVFKRLSRLIKSEISDVNDSTVDLYLDRANSMVMERDLGQIDFKHRFVLLEILFLLAQNPGKYYDKDQLARCIWKDEYNPLIHDKLIYTSVSRLRKLIEPKEKKRKYIIRGKDGYTFNPLVKTRFHREVGPGATATYGNVELSSPV